MLRQRGPHQAQKAKDANSPLSYSQSRPALALTSRSSSSTSLSSSTAMHRHDDPRRPLLAADDPASPLSSADPAFTSLSASNETAERQEQLHEDRDAAMEKLSRKSQWIMLALASGTCAAFNGVFAKLTTTELTTNFATTIANVLGIGSGEKAVEVTIRGIFFLLNLVFNGIMWALFTKALARGTSTTQVSIVNTSSNFMITAVLGFIIFNESLPPLWWLGAAMLVAGNVIIGRREEEEEGKDGWEGGESRGGLEGEVAKSSGEEERDVLLAVQDVELRDTLDFDVDAEIKRQSQRQEENILQLG